MTTRQSIAHDPTDPQSHLPTGYDPLGDAPSDYFIPSCGIEDSDDALFNLFDRQLGFKTKDIKTKKGVLQMGVPNVIFATGERFALVKRMQPARDTNNAMILPAISIRRTGLEQTDEDITGRGINQMTGALVVKRRLYVGDRDYQKFLNKYMFNNLAPDGSDSRREQGESYKEDIAIQQGMLLQPELKNNIFEIITVPSPQFFTSNYEVMFWTTHEKHMNYMLETLFNNFLPQRRGFKIETAQGYWFLADVDEQITNEGNSDDYTDEKRLIQYTINIKVKGYIFASSTPGNAVPVQRYISAPTVLFNIAEGNDVHKVDEIKKLEKNPFALTDLEQDNPQTPTTIERFVVKKEFINAAGDKETKYLQISDQNKRKGETVYTSTDPKSLGNFLFRNKSTP